MSDVESEKRWDELFAASQEMLSEMAAKALAEDRAGNTRDLDVDDDCFWLKASESSLREIWDNPEDDVYAELLKK